MEKTTSSPVLVKIEVESQEEESVQCWLCSKSFFSVTALNNHCRNEHTSAVEAGLDPTSWTNSTPPKQTPKKKTRSPYKQLQYNAQADERKNEILSSLKPVNLVSLASEDVSYILIKSDDHEEVVSAKKSRKSGSEDDKPEKKKTRHYSKRDKEPMPITGPFECQQPSTVVADQLCRQIFFSCCEYSTHYRDEHTKRRKGQRCQVCEKTLVPGAGEEPVHTFCCQVCGLQTENNKALQDHINTAHVKLRPFQCSICNKRFTQQGGLVQHLRMHTGVRPYPCTFCSKAFTQKSGLEQHLRTHTKVKPYRCVVCGKRFCQSIHLKQHMRIHTNVAPFQCGICEKRFKQSSHLNYHLKSHADGPMTAEQKKKLAELIGFAKESGQLVQVEGESELVDAAEVVELEVEGEEQEEEELDEETMEVVEEEIVEGNALEPESVIVEPLEYVVESGDWEVWCLKTE